MRTDRSAPEMPPVMAAFALATLVPVGLMLAGVVAGGGPWALLGLAAITVAVALLDRIAAPLPMAEGVEFPGPDRFLAGLASLHLAALAVAVWAIAGDSSLAPWQRAVMFAGFGLWFGQVANPAAHELIHRGDRRLFALGVAVYASLGFGQHASAHRLVHHVRAATPADPNTARAGEGFYRFFLRAWAGSFRAGWQAEAARGRRVHPYVCYGVGTGFAVAVALALAGGWGVLAWAGLSLHAQAQLLLSDYVQHYGLLRRTGPDGRREPVGIRHSWNAPHAASGAMTLNAPRHSDHHAHPSRPFPALRLPDPDAAPHLPFPLPVACTLALFPRLWQRVMAPHLARWQG